MKNLLFLLLFTGLIMSCETSDVKNLEVAAFKSSFANAENAILLDVRTPKETAQGMIEGAMEIDFRSPDFESKIEALDKDKAYYIYCRSGNRSGQAARLMEKKGFEEVYNLVGGYNAYQ